MYNFIMKLSVIIPTFNRAETLRTCLSKLMIQEGADFEVIVVDDGSKDDTAEVVRSFVGLPSVHPSVVLKYLKQPNLHQAAARNNGVKNAVGDIIIFIGDDIFVEPGWLKAHAEFHATYPEKEAMAVGHMTWSPEERGDRFMKWLEDTGLMPNYRGLKNNQKTDYWHFYTGNVSLKKSWFETHHFDEHFKAYGWEDTKFGYELMKVGAQLHYLKHAVGLHHHALSESDYFPTRMREIGKSAVLFCEIYPEVPLIPYGLKRSILSILASRPVRSVAGLLKKEWGWYCQSKRYFLEGVGKYKKPKSYLIIGSYGASNIGDEAMLEMILKHLPKASKKYVLSGHPADTAVRHTGMTKVFSHLPFGLRSFFRFKWPRSLRLIGQVDEVLLGGGGLFVDDYRKKAVPLWAWHVLWCRLQGKKPVLFANSVGPLKTWFGRFLTKWSLRRCRLIIVRDPDSDKLVRQMLPKANVFLGADLAFLFSQPKPRARQKMVAINLRDWKMDPGILKNCVHSLRQNGYELVPVAMEPKDKEILSKITDESSVTVPQNFSSLCQLLAECEYAVGMRLHFLIAAVISGCKVGAIAYSDKVIGIMKELGVPYVTPSSACEKSLADLLKKAKKVTSYSLQKKRAEEMFEKID
jgi:polysaccharide pyruvyl transferase CsaB